MVVNGRLYRVNDLQGKVMVYLPIGLREVNVVLPYYLVVALAAVWVAQRLTRAYALCSVVVNVRTRSVLWW